MQLEELLNEAWRAYHRQGESASDAVFARALREAVQDPDYTGLLSYLLAEQCWFWAATTRVEQAKSRLIYAYRTRSDPGLYWEAFKMLIRRLPDSEAAALIKRGQFIDEYHVYSAAKLSEYLARNGRTRLAKFLIKRVIKVARDEGWLDAVYRAEGRFGRILEREGHIEKAISLLKESIYSGNTDYLAIDRLSLMLERQRKYEDAVSVLEYSARNRMNDAGRIDTVLAQRLQRCRTKGAAAEHGVRNTADN